MSGPLGENETVAPEELPGRLAGRLHRHVLWDFLFVVVPPLLAFSYFVFVLNYLALISREALFVIAAVILGITSFLGFLRYRLKSPPVLWTARLIDERVEGKDRFVTLATIDPSSYSSSLVARLRHEAARLLHRVNLTKDFPYRVKRSFFVSLIGTLAGILLFHLFAQLVFFSALRGSSIAELSRELSREPRLAELAEIFKAAAARIETERLSSDEQRLLIQDLLKRVEQLTAARQQRSKEADLLDQVADALRRSEQGAGKDQKEGGGDIKTNLPEDREGEGKDSGKGGDRDPEGKMNAVESQGLEGGKLAQMKGQEEGRHEGEGQRGTENQLDKESKEKKEIKNETQGKPEQKGSRQQGSEIPSGKEPDRFLEPGQGGGQGIKGARFVTVQLPEAQAVDSAGKGESGKSVKLKPKVPISNVPLRGPDSSGASGEKQPLPLEYRGLIR